MEQCGLPSTDTEQTEGLGAPLPEQVCGFQLSQGHDHKAPDVPLLEIRVHPKAPGKFLQHRLGSGFDAFITPRLWIWVCVLSSFKQIKFSCLKFSQVIGQSSGGPVMPRIVA